MTLILLVDDDNDVREAAGLILTGAAACGGCYVVHAADGHAALVLARTRRPDVIVADLRMPILDGAELISLLREDPELSDIPVVLMSADPDLCQIARERRADAHLQKPFDGAALLRTVEAMYARRRDARHEARHHAGRAP